MRRLRYNRTSGKGAIIVEAMCYRFLSHTTDDVERTYRTREEVAEQRVNATTDAIEQEPSPDAWV